MDANLTYRASSPRTSSGVGIVILLYEQLVQDLRRAAAMIDEGDVEARTSELAHALGVVGQLQARLDMELGGEVAQNLDRFYGLLRAGILNAQFKTSKAALEKLIADVLSVREAWLVVERSTISGQNAAEISAASTAQAPSSSSVVVPRDWKA